MEPRSVTREELYQLVWQTPMNRLAEEFGVSGNGLAKICDRLDVPYPSRGYWAKKEAGKAAVVFKLLPRKEGVPEQTDIYPTPPKPVPKPEIAEAAEAAAEKVGGIVVPVGLDALHPRVKVWRKEHKAAHEERRREARRDGPNSWFARSPLPDLAERDLYRFRVTSALFQAVEKAGAKIESSPITGKVTFLVDGHAVECSIVEKLIKSLKQYKDQGNWTAYPNHHQHGLESSGYLRVSIGTYLGGGKTEWVETEKKSIGDLLPAIVGTIMAAGPFLESRKQEREERERKRQEEEARRYKERERLELDSRRWAKFSEFAANWSERHQLLCFLEEVEKRAAVEEEAGSGDISRSDWIKWARERVEALDPFNGGVAGMFDAIAKVPRWP